MGVSTNGGTPKSSILMGFSMINHPFWGSPIFRKPPYRYRGEIHLEIGVIFQACAIGRRVLQRKPFPELSSWKLVRKHTWSEATAFLSGRLQLAWII